MSRSHRLFALFSQRSATPSLVPHPHQRKFLKPFSTSILRHAESQEHNLSSPSRPQPTSPASGGAPTPQTHPTYFPVSARSPPNSEAAGSSRNFYRTHGRALFKALTLAFFTYQVLYWAWLSLETEEIKDGVRREVKGLEAEVRLLDEGRRSHGEAMRRVVGGPEDKGERRVLEEGER